MDTQNPNQLTASGITATLGNQPEFVTSKRADHIYGLCKTQLYALGAEGKIKSVCIRKSGSGRGKRLWSCDSIRNFLNANLTGATR